MRAEAMSETEQKNSFRENVPGDRFVFEFPFEHFVPQQERVDAYDKDNKSGRDGNWAD